MHDTELTALRIRASAPPGAIWLNRADIAALLGCSLRSADQVIAQPGFPEPARVPGIKYPRWRLQEFVDWSASLV